MPGDCNRRRQLARQYESDLLEGERLLVYYAADLAPCTCVSHDFVGVPCIPVGRHGGVDRCLICGSTWKQRRNSSSELKVLWLREAAA